MSKPFTCQFVAIPEQVLRSNVSPNAKLIYGVILAMYKCNTIVNCGNAYLGEPVGIKESAVAKIIVELKEADFIDTSLRGRVRTIFPKIKTTKSK